MLKTGIYKLSQLTQKNILNEDKKISIILYNEICNLPNPDKLIEKTLLLFTDEHGAYKRTSHHRFEGFDQKVEKILCKNFSSKSSLIVEDVAISNGRTSVDFFRRLSPHFSKLSFRGSDYDPEIFIVKQGRIKIVLSKSQKLLEIVAPPFVLNTTRFVKRDFLYPLNFLILYFLKFFLIPSLIKKFKKGQTKGEKVVLFCREALDLSKKDKRFKLGQHNILDSFENPGKIDVIRAMNVLNLSYFNPSQMSAIISNIFDGLKEGGYFIIGSNQDAGSLVHGGVYRKAKDRFKKIEQSGEGASIQNEILSFKHLRP